MGGTFHQRTLVRRLQSTQQTMKVLVPTLRRADLKLATVERQLHAFMKNVRSGVSRGRINADLGRSTLETLDGILTSLDGLQPPPR